MADILNKHELIGKILTWQEIKEYFPDQWVGLTNVKYKNNDGISIESGRLLHIDKTKDELTVMMLDGECVARYTTPNNTFKLGTIGGF